MIALECGIDTASSIGAPELIQSTRRPSAAFFVLATTTVEVSITFLFGWHARIGYFAIVADAGRVARQSAVNVVGLTFAKCWKEKRLSNMKSIIACLLTAL